MTPTQCKMARVAMDWTGKDLAARAKIGSATVARYELGESIHPDKLEAMQAAFVAAGVVFVVKGQYAGAVVPPRRT